MAEGWTVTRSWAAPVAMRAEDDYGNPVLGFDTAAARVVLMASPAVG